MSIACQAMGGINLGQGICDLPAPRTVKARARAAIEEDVASYSHPRGLTELRRAVADKIQVFYGPWFDPEKEVVITAGATGGMAAALMALTEPGDEIILFEPYYGYHLNTVLMLGLQPKIIPLQPPGWLIRKEALERAVSTRTRGIILCSPSNPSGKVLFRPELQLLADFCQTHDLIAFCDEIYEHIVFGGTSHVPLHTLPNMRDRCINISGFSKTFSITGWRVGYLTGPAELVEKIAIAHDLLYVCAPTPLQDACYRGLAEVPHAYYRELSTEFERKRNLICSALTDAGLYPYLPQGAYYVLADVKRLGHKTSRAAAMWILEAGGVATIPGSSFFQDEIGETMVRICFAKPDSDLHAAGSRLRRL